MKFKDGIVILEGENPEEAYVKLRHVILDNLIPLNKVIGLKLTSSSDSAVATAADRHYALQENMIELGNNLSQLILLPTYNGFSGEVTGTSNIVNIEECSDVAVISGHVNFISSGRSIEPLDKDLYLYYPVENIGVRLFVHEATGSRTMEENVETMKEAYSGIEGKTHEFLPLNTEHTLVQHIRILPWLGEGPIKYRLFKGMTDEILNLLWKVYEKGGCK